MNGKRTAPDLRRLFSARGIGALWNVLSGFRALYLVAVLCIAAAAAARTVSYFLLRSFVDNVLDRGGDAAAVLFFALWFTLLAAVEAVTTYLRGRLAARSAEGGVLSLRNFLFDHIQRLTFPYHDRVRTGDLIERVTSDVETIQRFFGEQATEIGRILAMFLINFAALLVLDPVLGLLSIVLLPVIILISIVFFARILKRYDEYQDQEAALSSTLQENVAAVRIVRAFARRDFEMDKFERDNAEKYRRGRRLVRLHALYWPITDILCFAQSIFIFCLGADAVLRHAMSAGTFLAVIGMVSLVVWPMRNLGRIIVEASMAVVSSKRLGEVAMEEPEGYKESCLEVESSKRLGEVAKEETEGYRSSALEVKFAERARPSTATRSSAGAPRIRGEVEFESVCFSYDGGGQVLCDVSFKAASGRVTAVMGPTGSGKTSLVSLIPRFYHPTAGVVRVDGRDVREYGLEELRRHIGIVEQEPFLFSRTLRENLAYGAGRPVTEEEIAAAVRAAALEEVIAAFPEGYDTLVGERGVTLSGGQKQRVAVARTLLKDPAILILDDATSSVDTETEAAIRESLRSLMRRKTCFVIAHRVQTVKNADMILVLKEGRVAERGTHRELSAGRGFYRTVWEMQSRIEGGRDRRARTSIKGE